MIHDSKVSCFLAPMLPPLNFKGGRASIAHWGDLVPIHRALPESLCLKSGYFGVGCMSEQDTSMFCTDLTMKNKIEMCFLPFIHTLSVLLSHQFSGLSSRSRHNSSESKMMWHQWNRLYVTNYLFLCQEKGNVLLKKFADVTGEKCNLSSCMTGKRDLLCCSNFIAITMQHNLYVKIHSNGEHTTCQKRKQLCMVREPKE